jgi:hypothetical protein
VELNLSILWVIAFVLVLTFVVNRLLIKPLTETMSKRQAAIDSARALADRAAAEARSATVEFERKTADARAEVYRQMDDMRRVATDERRSGGGAQRRHEPAPGGSRSRARGAARRRREAGQRSGGPHSRTADELGPGKGTTA